MRLGVGLGLARRRSAQVATLATQAAWTHVFEGGVAMLPVSPGDFVSWGDQAGALSIVPAGAGRAQTTSDPGVHFSNNANQRLHVATTLTAGTDFGVYVRAKTAGGAWACVAFDCDGAATLWAMLQISTTAISVSLYDGAETQLVDTFGAGSGLHDVFFGRTGGTGRLVVDARTPITAACAQTMTGLTNLSVGNMIFAGPTPFGVGTGDVRSIGWKSGAEITAGERAAILAYSAAHP